MSITCLISELLSDGGAALLENDGKRGLMFSEECDLSWHPKGKADGCGGRVRCDLNVGLPLAELRPANMLKYSVGAGGAGNFE